MATYCTVLFESVLAMEAPLSSCKLLIKNGLRPSPEVCSIAANRPGESLQLIDFKLLVATLTTSSGF
jgi:hypothetical protein